MNICFIACFYKTVLFQRIAKELENRISNITISWISTSPKWTNYLVNNGVRKELITQITPRDEIQFQDRKIARETLDKAEKINDRSANFIIQSDRIISHWAQDRAEEYLLYCTHTINKKIKNEKIRIIFGETTALHETLTAFICKTQGAEFKKPHTIRIPSNRFAFFDGYLEENTHKNNTLNSELSLEDIIQDVTERNKKPAYFYINNKKPKILDKKLLKEIPKKLISTLKEQSNNAAEKSIFHHLIIEKKYLAPIRAKRLYRNIKFESPVPGERNILFTLHKQPEASIDVLGTEHSNQIELIRKISINTPSQYKIYIKEHSNAIGDRPLSFLKSIKKIPNVRLIDPAHDSHELIKKSSLVITISGTIAFEAALFGIKSATFSPMFFNTLPLCTYIRNPSDIPRLLSESPTHSPDITKIAFSQIINNSYQGTISDPISDPDCISEKNISLVSDAFERLINEKKEATHNM
ncbi:hypothetical protein [Pseudomonas nicosulfuronedens]